MEKQENEELKLCECGCGKPVTKPKNRFIHGHNSSNLGRTFSEEWVKNLSISHKGQKQSEKNKEILRRINTGKILSLEHKEALLRSNRNRKMSPEHKEVLRKINTGRKMSPEHKEKLRKANTGKTRSDKHKKQISDANKGHFVSEKTKDAVRKANKNRTISLETRQKIKEFQNQPETIKAKREILKIKWQDPEFVAKQMKARLRTKKNKKETQLESILDEYYPNEWKFVGDGQLIIAGKCPDFVNVNGKKLLIELFGDYWHKDDNPQDRIDVFTPFGYRTLVIWESELKENFILLNKINLFITGGK